MLKAGKYLCRVLAPSNGWFGEAGENNTPFIRLPLVITEEGDCEGDETTWQGWLSEKSIDRTCKTLAEVFGWDGDLEALSNQLKTGPFVGKECRITAEQEEYNGKKKVVIKWLNRADGGGKTMAADAAKLLAQRLNARAKAAAATAEEPKPRESGSRPPQRPPSNPDLDAPEDDIPF